MSTDATGTPSTDASFRAALDAFAARTRPLVALDFDGCLAPLVDDRDAARPTPRAAAALAALGDLPEDRRPLLALVSGRPLEPLSRLAAPPAGTALVGSHGAEVRLPGDDAATAPLEEHERALLADVTAAVRRVVETHPGTDLEPKPAGAVLHTRNADVATASAAARAVVDGPGRLPGVHALRGKDVVELAVLDVDKGRSVQMLRERLGADVVLYAGDDVTDEHALAVLDPAAGDVGVKVGPGETAASFRVADPDAVAEVLEHLVAAFSR
ncbi:trehalose-phosphatase [Pseudokineococcus lusitanus]|jgi:trehalose-phosphatase|uniref:Trehalose 6-phosphate phosphatase n=1 Tax=Pseudokineococcus lusitanus TaxID=763993 RepID=A0A3N1HLI2_9ACTN|nr:trehalose-phosphatase [Pseudokineococcus lusitanus]ROP43367.1 trehalose 6-phosphatase [Pseudokineococcus lusitanus]